MSDELALRVVTKMRQGNLTLSVVESCTGGRLSAAITAIPGSSNVYRGGLIAYANAVKAQLLGVDWATIDEHGAVSDATVREMAANGHLMFRTDFTIATTGIAGPDGGSAGKPVGLVYIAWAGPDELDVRDYRFTGERRDVQDQATGQALLVLEEKLGKL